MRRQPPSGPMKPAGFALALLALAVAGCIAPAGAPVQPAGLGALPDPAAFVQEGPFSRTLAPGAFGILPVEVVDIPSLEGGLLRVGLHRPDVPEGTRVPVILQASPYFGNGEGPVDAITGDRMAQFLVENLVPHGYAVALLPLRGTGDSQGCFDFGGPLEQADADATVTWLAEQPWSNGNVGMTGKSYDGSPMWAVAALGNPALKTIVPISGLTGIKTMHFVNGTAETRTTLLWAFYWMSSLNAEGRGDGGKLTGTCADTAAAFLHATHGTATGDARAAGASDYWLVREYGEAALANYEGSLFLVHGLQDFNVHPDIGVPLFNAFAGPKKALLGQWRHDYPDRPEANPHATRWDFAESLLRWFDRELKGLDVDVGPVVDVEDNQGRWRLEAAWPPLDATFLNLRLGDGTLGGEPAPAEVAITPPVQGGFVPFAGVGVPLGLQGGEAWFEGEPLAAELRVSGAPQVPLAITPSGQGGQVAAYLYDLADGAEPVLVGHGVMDLRFHDGGDEARALAPGEEVVARLQLFPLDAVVPAGHRLALRVTQDVPGNFVQSPLAAPFALRVGGDAESLLRLPVIARGEAQLAGGWPLRGPAPGDDGGFDPDARP